MHSPRRRHPVHQLGTDKLHPVDSVLGINPKAQATADGAELSCHGLIVWSQSMEGLIEIGAWTAYSGAMCQTTLAAFQFNPLAGEVDRNLAEVEKALREAAASGIQFVGLPEMWPTSFVDVAGQAEELVERTAAALQRVEELTRELDLVVCGSAFGPTGDPDRLYNRLHVIDRGKHVTTYDKVHLFTPTAEPRHFLAGDRAPEVVDTLAGRVAGATCYDLRFPETFRPAFRDGVQILCVPAQWPEVRILQWRALAIARAVENQCFVVAVNRTGTVKIGRRGKELLFPGASLIVDPHGAVLAEAAGESGLVSAQVDLAAARQMRVRIPVEKDERAALYSEWQREAQQK